MMEEDDGKMEIEKLEILGNHIEVRLVTCWKHRGLVDGMNMHSESSRQAETRPTYTSENGLLGAETNATNYSLLNPNIASRSGKREYIRHGSRHNFSNLARANKSNSYGHFGFQEGKITLTSIANDYSAAEMTQNTDKKNSSA
ncbi:hypothetical protein L6452_09324 [Arctium lappa]|uniref:Uncharacterized protein n=1 Tax=Arctium lappa TaxID=4217 RepID=A0ACB9DK23_ARCLA|nr:hypothetical protein L6452_09324 [Arctium lappa]